MRRRMSGRFLRAGTDVQITRQGVERDCDLLVRRCDNALLACAPDVLLVRYTRLMIASQPDKNVLPRHTCIDILEPHLMLRIECFWRRLVGSTDRHLKGNEKRAGDHFLTL